LCVAQADEQRVLGVALGLGGAVEVPLAGRGEGDEVTAAILGVALAGDEVIGLQRVEHRDQNAGVGPDGLPELGLAHRPVVVEHAEQMKLAGRQMAGGMGIAQSSHRDMAEQSQQQPGTRAPLVKDRCL
jgi:hypothetical protein